MANVLVIDDDESIGRVLTKLVRNLNHHAAYTLTLKEGIKKVQSGSFDVVFLDVNLPDGSGLDAIEKIRNISKLPEIIIITGAGDPDGAEIAIKNGAWDYIQKPISPKKVILPLKRVLQYRDDLKKVLKQPVSLKREGIIGSSRKINACIEQIGRAVNGDANVLLTGETGTGKELFAKAIHENSSRSNENFVVVDCTALPETLVESMLFGHAKGAFTGAERPTDGLIKMADKGTLFLDEVGELSLELQKAFLRVLQERRFRPVGNSHELESNFRLVSATNKNFEQMVKTGHFREDLLHRLRTLIIELPPLRQRSKDIPELVWHYCRKICERYKIKPKGFSPDFIEALSSYEWPGNVRELVNTLESAVSQAHQVPILFPQHLPTHLRIQMARASVVLTGDIPKEAEFVEKAEERYFSSSEMPPTYKDFRVSVVVEAEKAYLQNLMAFTDGDMKKACRISNLSRARLYTLLKKHNYPDRE